MSVGFASPTEKLGPLKVWQWGVLGGGALLVIVLLKGKGKSSVGPLTVVPQLDFTGKTPPAGLGGGLLGELTKFICQMPNAPNALSISTPDGSTLTLNNGIPTFGSSAAWQQNQNGSTSPVSTWNPCKPAETAPSPGGGPTTPPPSPFPGLQWIGSGPGLIPFIPWPSGSQPGTQLPVGYNPKTRTFDSLNYPLQIAGPTIPVIDNGDGTISL